jgi:hypothetical protein
MFEFDAVQAKAWSDRAMVVIRATKLGELLPRFTNDPNHWFCRFCGHRKRCWGS